MMHGTIGTRNGRSIRLLIDLVRSVPSEEFLRRLDSSS
jgi:hypothetical protein